MKPLPRRLTIRGITYSVHQKRNLIGADGTGLLGLCEYDNGRITLERDAPDDIRWQAFWHEVLHAATRGHEAARDEFLIDIIAGEIHGALKQMGFYGK